MLLVPVNKPALLCVFGGIPQSRLPGVGKAALLSRPRVRDMERIGTHLHTIVRMQALPTGRAAVYGIWHMAWRENGADGGSLAGPLSAWFGGGSYAVQAIN